jgi:cyclase
MMKRKALLVALLAVFAGTASAVQQGIQTSGPIPDRRHFNGSVGIPEAVSKVEWVTRKVAGNVYVLAGAGGHVTVQSGDDGMLLVDTNFNVFYPQIREQMRKISDKPVRIVVNTHSHFDHNQNNAEFAKQGALIFTQPATRTALMQQTRPSPVPREGLPVVTSTSPMSFHFNGEEVAYIPLKLTETPGEVGVYFRRSDVFVFGDLYVQTYPYINVQNGATIENILDNFNLALQMTTPNTVFVPGHGQLGTREDLIAVRDAVSTIHDRVVKMVAAGMTVEQIWEARPSKEFDARFSWETVVPTPGFYNANLEGATRRFYDRLFEEAKAHMAQR